MRYRERIIRHNVKSPRLVKNSSKELVKIDYNSADISHHPKSFEYWMIHGIVLNNKRYIIKELFVRDSNIFAVVTPDEKEYYELEFGGSQKDMSRIDQLEQEIINIKKLPKYDDTEIKKRIEALEIKEDKDAQTLSINGNILQISNGNSVQLPEHTDTVYDDTEVKRRIKELEDKPEKEAQTLGLTERTLSISGGNSIELPEDKDTVYDDSGIKKELQELKESYSSSVQTLSIEDRVVRISGGNSIELPEDKDTIYDDTNVRQELESLRTSVANVKQTTDANTEKFGKLGLLSVDEGGSTLLSIAETTEPFVMPNYEITSSGNLVLNKTTDEVTKTTTWDLKVDAEHLNNDLRATNPGETVRYSNKDLGVVSTKGVTATIELVDVLNPDKIRVGDTVLCEYRKDGVLYLDYWTVTAVGSSNADLVGIKSTQIQLGSTQPVKDKRIHLSNLTTYYTGDKLGTLVHIDKSNIIIDGKLEVGDTIVAIFASHDTIYLQRYQVSATSSQGDDSTCEATATGLLKSRISVDLSSLVTNTEFQKLNKKYEETKANLDKVLKLLYRSGAIDGYNNPIEGTLLALEH